MKRHTKLIAKYSQTGHWDYPEDTWDDSRVVFGEDDLFEDMKYWHKESARTCNDYPFNGMFSPSNIEFLTQNVITDENGEVFYGKKVVCDAPEYFPYAVKKYEEWYDTIKRRLPRLQKLNEKRKREEKERKQFEELSKKFGS